MQLNNIERIIDFINSEKKGLLINIQNEEVNFFYNDVIKYLAKKNNIQIKTKDYGDTSINDLFSDVKIFTYNTNSTKNIEVIINSNEKFILFTDYKNFKKISNNLIKINSYSFEKDIIFFLKQIEQIEDKNLIQYCINNPHLLFSEIHKFQINGNYVNDSNIKVKDDFILNIRRNIFNQKKNLKNIKAIYQLNKEEIIYKKFSFLTF